MTFINSSQFLYQTFDLLSTGTILSQFPAKIEPLNLTSLTNQNLPAIPQPIQHDNLTIHQFDQYFSNQHKTAINFAKFSAHSRYLLSGGKDNCLKLVELQKARVESKDREQQQGQRSRHTFYGHYQEILDAVAHPTHELLCSCGADCDIRFFNLKQNEAEALIYSFGMGRQCTSLDFVSFNQLAIANGMNCVHLYDLQVQQKFTQTIGITDCIQKVKVYSGGMACLGNLGLYFIDQRCNCQQTIPAQQINSFCIQNQYAAVCGNSGTFIYDVRKTNQYILKLPDINLSISGVQNGRFWVGLNSADNSLRIYQANGEPNECRNGITYTYKLQSVEGSDSSASLCIVYDKTYCVCDIK